jgi:hypothetical protein
MMVGGTLELPVVDAGEVDLSAAELSGGTLDTHLRRRSRSGCPDLSTTEMQGGNSSVKDDEEDVQRRRSDRSEMPSKNAKYVGATPSMALSKAARRIHKKNPTKLKFSVLMRRVTQAFREGVYMYDVTMVKAPKPQGFVTFEVDTRPYYGGRTGKLHEKVQVVQASDQPVFGYINETERVSRIRTLGQGVHTRQDPRNEHTICSHRRHSPFQDL